VHRPDMVFENNVYGCADGLVVITAEAEEDGTFWARVEIPIHNQVKKGDVFLYKYDELWLGTEAKWKDWNLEGLADFIMGGVKHKKIDTINTHPVEEMDVVAASCAKTGRSVITNNREGTYDSLGEVDADATLEGEELQSCRPSNNCFTFSRTFLWYKSFVDY